MIDLEQTDAARPARRRALLGARVPRAMVPSMVRRGYSVMELLTVIMVGLIVSVIGFSGFQIYERRLPARSSALRFSYALSTARTFAISRNGFYRVVLDLDNENFWIDELADPADTSFGEYRPKVVSPERIDERARIEGVLQTGSGAVQTSGFQRFVFRPDGSSDRDARIYFFNRGEDTTLERNIYTVRLYGPTGVNEVFDRQRL